MTDAETRQRRRARRVLRTLVFACVAFGLLAYYGMYAANRHVREQLLRGFRDAGFDTTHDSISVDLLTRTAVIRGLVVSSRNKAFRCEIPRINIAFSSAPLMENMLIVDVELVRPTFVFAPAEPAARSRPRPPAPDREPFNIILKELTVTGGHFEAANPALAGLLAWDTLEGRVRGALSLSHLAADAGFTGSNSAHGKLDIILERPDNGRLPIHMSFQAQADARMESFRLAHFEIEAPLVHFAAAGRGWVDLTESRPAARVELSGRIDYKRVAPLLAATVREQVEGTGVAFDGPVRLVSAEVFSDEGGDVVVAAELDLTDVAFSAPLAITGAAASQPLVSGTPAAPVALRVSKAAGDRLVVTPRLVVGRDGACVTSDVEVARLAVDAGLPSALVLGGRTTLSLAADRGGRVEGECVFSELDFTYGDIEGAIAGALALSPERVSTSGLTFNCAQGQFTVVGEAVRADDRVRADVLVSVPSFDLAAAHKALKAAGAGDASPQTARNDAVAGALPPATDWAAIHAAIAPLDVDANLLLGNITHSDFSIESASAHVLLKDGRLTCRRLRGRACRGMFNLDGTSVDCAQNPPECHLVYDFKNMRPEPLLEDFVEFLFYQLTFTGEFSSEGEVYFHLHPRRTEQELVRFWKSFNGAGSWGTTLGYLEGPAAADFARTIVPALNLVRYRFNRMTADMRIVNGRSESRMYFDADNGNIDVEGWTDTKGKFQYDMYVRGGARGADRSRSGARMRLLSYVGRVDRDGNVEELYVRNPADQDTINAIKRYLVDPVRRRMGLDEDRPSNPGIDALQE